MDSVAQLVRRNAASVPDRIAMRFEGRDTSHQELYQEVCRAANALNISGVSEGDRISYLGKNTDRYFVLLYAAAQLGATMVPVGWRLAPPEIAYILNDTGSLILFTDCTCASVAERLRPELSSIREIVCVDDRDGRNAFEEWLASTDLTDNHVLDDADRVFLQLYTSGTTGKPKGVMLSSRNFNGRRTSCREAGIAWDQWGDDEVALVAMTIAHVAGSGYGIMALYHRATALIMREFSPEQMLVLIRDEGVSKFFLAPAAIQITMRHPDARSVDYSRIRHILYGSSPMPLALLREAVEVFGAGLVQHYGLTETAGTIVALGAEDHDPANSERMRSAGKALPGVELKIVDAEGDALPPGIVGEIVTRSDSNMIGYWNLPEATAKTIDVKGWLHTGDAGYLDADGYLYICDRVKDMICTGGENVYPAEVEAVLYDHPDVQDAAVIGVPDEKWGEAVKAVIVARPGRRIDAADLIAWSRARLAGFKLPKSVDFADTLPRSATGKILKKDLRAPYWEGRDRQVN